MANPSLSGPDQPHTGKVGYRTPLKTARGLGSAKSGVHHWIMQRLTAIANVILVLWVIVALLTVVGRDHDDVVEWMAAPWVAIPLVLVFANTFWHAALGLQVVIEDYVGSKGARIALIVAVRFVIFAFAAVGIFSVARVALTAPLG